MRSACARPCRPGGWTGRLYFSCSGPAILNGQCDGASFVCWCDELLPTDAQVTVGWEGVPWQHALVHVMLSIHRGLKLGDAQVRIRGLKQKVELNQQSGTIVGHGAAAGGSDTRLEVRVGGAHSTVRVKPVNVFPAQCPAHGGGAGRQRHSAMKQRVCTCDVRRTRTPRRAHGRAGYRGPARAPE